MNEIGDPCYDKLLKLNMLRAELGIKSYNITLKLLNDLMELKGENKYKCFMDFKCVSEKCLVFDEIKIKKMEKYRKKFKKHLGLDLDLDNVLVTELRRILESQGYKLKHYTKTKTYTIIKNN